MTNRQGMFNHSTGKWNPSTDAFRYNSGNSITGNDIIAGIFGHRIIGTGAKLPIWLQPVEKSINAGKRIKEIKGNVDWKIKKALRGTKFPRRDLQRKERIKQDLKTVGRAMNSRKGRIGIPLTTAMLTQWLSSDDGGSHTNFFGGGEEFILHKKKAHGGRYF